MPTSPERPDVLTFDLPIGGSLDKLAPLPKTLVAAFGDSMMWGQGIAREARYSVLTAGAIGKVHKQQGVLAYDRSRSGAQIKVRDGSDREDFVDTYPGLFPSHTVVEAFLGGDESAALELFGEVPCTFPTIGEQVRLMPAELGTKIDAALVCGGANDINFEALLDSTQNRGKFVDKFSGDIREICFQDTRELIGKVRAKMPNAVILLFGYFPPMSYQTDPGKLKEYFKFELNSAVKWYLNGAANFLGISGSVDVDEAILEARARSVWAHGLSTYWLRRAVTEANQDDTLRGPGIIFVPCGFLPQNSVFAREPMVHGDYEHPTDDAMQAEREKRIPRIKALPDLATMLARVLLSNFKGAKALREEIDGPTSLETALFTRTTQRGRTPAELLAAEIYRIHRALIASFFHPNKAGAAQYASMAAARYNAHRRAQLPHHMPFFESLETRLARFGLRGSGPLPADVGHQFVDAIRVTVHTARNSTKNFAPDIMLLLVLRQESGGHHDTITLQLNMQYERKEVLGAPLITKFHPEFEPDQTDEFCVDVSSHGRERQVLLSDIIGMKITVGRQPALEQIWLPKELRLDINGIEVLHRDLSGKKLGAGDSVDLNYPG